MKLKNKKIKSSELKEKIAQYFEKSIESSGAFNSGDPQVKKIYVEGVLKNKIEKEVYRIIKAYIPPQKNVKILDMGCGLGGFLAVCKDEEIQAMGIEIDPYAAKIAKLRAGDKKSILLGNCEDMPFPNKSFDLAVSITVIEHVKNPTKYLGEAYRILRKNGKLIIFAPNYLFPWEGHYKLFWLPYIFPYTKYLFKVYLKLKNRNPNFVDFVNFKITPNYLKKTLRRVGFSKIQNLSIERFKKRIDKPELINNPEAKKLMTKIKKHKFLYVFIKSLLPILKTSKLYHPIILVVTK